ncbi:hypothetical protein HK100_011927, partial [Physocladia obscura]
FGIEGIVHAKAASSEDDAAEFLTYDAIANTLLCETTGEKISIFKKVIVRVQVEEAGHEAAQRSKLVVRLVEPVVPGLSVKSLGKVDEVPAVVEIPGVGKVKTTSSDRVATPVTKKAKSKK